MSRRATVDDGRAYLYTCDGCGWQQTFAGWAELAQVAACRHGWRSVRGRRGRRRTYCERCWQRRETMHT